MAKKVGKLGVQWLVPAAIVLLATTIYGVKYVKEGFAAAATRKN